MHSTICKHDSKILIDTDTTHTRFMKLPKPMFLYLPFRCPRHEAPSWRARLAGSRRWRPPRSRWSRPHRRLGDWHWRLKIRKFRTPCRLADPAVKRARSRNILTLFRRIPVSVYSKGSVLRIRICQWLIIICIQWHESNLKSLGDSVTVIQRNIPSSFLLTCH